MIKLEWIIDKDVQQTAAPLTACMERAACQAPDAEGIQLDCAATIRLCGDEVIRAVNGTERGIDRATDVLSFPSVQYPAGKTAGQCEGLLRQEYDDESGACFLGDIMISVPHALAQAKEYGHSAEREAAYLLVHGLCHLMGYDHIQEEDRTKMRAKEEKILSAAGLTREEEAKNAEGPRDGKEAGNEDAELLQMAREARKRSYSPYSRFSVGAALRTAAGQIYQGCNIENASYGLGICAERTAVFKAVSEGVTKFTAIAIAAEIFAWPCGACRQVLNEFAPDIRVMVTDAAGNVRERNLQELLPESFGPAQLGQHTR